MKEKTFKEHRDAMEAKSLSKRLDSIHSDILWYIDRPTINYYKTQLVAKNIREHDDLQYTPTELSKRERENSIQILDWMIRDLEQCKKHLI